MIERLQDFGHRKSRYDRPNQKWVCGWAAQGDPCEHGPDGRGNCPARMETECQPRKIGDRWHCGRLGVFGGACKPGPNPDGACCLPTPRHPVCQPRLGWRAKRARLAFSTCCLTLGLLLIGIFGPWRYQVMSPGDLSAAHAGVGLLGDRLEQKCAACHTAADASGAGIIAAALKDFHDIDDAIRCLNCHFQSLPATDAVPFSPHSAPQESLAIKSEYWTTRLADENSAALKGNPFWLAVARNDEGKIACATCHREHGGRSASISAMGNDRCQRCHRAVFKSFDQGHPEFEPGERFEKGIAFDHTAHRQKDRLGDRSFDCLDCHLLSSDRVVMRTLPFEKSCFGCHYQSESDHHGDNIRSISTVIFQLPEMQVPDSIEWPENAALGDEELPYWMQFLLAGDPAAIEPLQDLWDAADGYAVDWDSDDELVAALAEAILGLLRELAAADTVNLRGRIARATGLTEDDIRVRALATELGTGALAFQAYQQTILSDRQGAAQAWAPHDAGGWFLDGDAGSIRYRIADHADPLLKSFIDVLAYRQESEGFAGELVTLVASSLASTSSGGTAYAACLRCHQSQTPDTMREIDWQATKRLPRGTGFASFGHAGHLLQTESKSDCLSCHRFSDAADGQIAARGGFATMQRQQCLPCHNSAAPASIDCTLCHKYHWLQP